MQTIAHLIVNKKKILVLVRIGKLNVALKLRLWGADGNFLEDESAFLESRPDVLGVLLAGKVVKL